MHLGIIMDGNRRWAKLHALETIFGHNNGVKALDRLLEVCPSLGIQTVTVYALSTENFVKRSEFEIINLVDVISNAALKYKEKLIGKNVRVKVLGEINKVPEKLKNSLLQLVDETKDCSKSLLQLCINYGGRNEIVRAVEKTIASGEEISEEAISRNLDSNLQPDLIIRPGGHKRLSNFLLWQSAYSELYFTDVLWPDFNENELIKALDYYNGQERKFGK
jgi:undecaprenyl diphosphate synthase